MVPAGFYDVILIGKTYPFLQGGKHLWLYSSNGRTKEKVLDEFFKDVFRTMKNCIY